MMPGMMILKCTFFYLTHILSYIFRRKGFLLPCQGIRDLKANPIQLNRTKTKTKPRVGSWVHKKKSSSLPKCHRFFHFSFSFSSLNFRPVSAFSYQFISYQFSVSVSDSIFGRLIHFFHFSFRFSYLN